MGFGNASPAADQKRERRRLHAAVEVQAVLLAEFEREVAMLHSLDASGHAYYETAAHHIKAARAALARSRQ